jgi:hypothetical protein
MKNVDLNYTNKDPNYANIFNDHKIIFNDILKQKQNKINYENYKFTDYNNSNTIDFYEILESISENLNTHKFVNSIEKTTLNYFSDSNYENLRNFKYLTTNKFDTYN